MGIPARRTHRDCSGEMQLGKKWPYSPFQTALLCARPHFTVCEVSVLAQRWEGM